MSSVGFIVQVSPGKEGPVFFGDEIRGHVLSYTFFLKDAQARGFHRWFSISVIMRDKFFLLNSWPFLVENIQTLVSALKAKAAEVRTLCFLFYLFIYFWFGLVLMARLTLIHWKESYRNKNFLFTSSGISVQSRWYICAVMVAAAWPAGSSAAYLQSESLQSSHNSVTKYSAIE